MALSVTFLTAAGADVSILEGRNGFVDFNRNNLLARFMQTDCTHVWFVDDDMGWDPKAIIGMLKKDKEFIAGAGPLKADGEPVFAIKHPVNEDQTPIVEDGLIKCSHIGGAFVLMKRSVIEKMMIGYPGHQCRAVDPTTGYNLYECVYGANTWTGEDYTFCERWTALGGEIWCYPNITFSHTGTKTWTGNYHQHLIAQPQPGEEVIESKNEMFGALIPATAKASDIAEPVKAMIERQEDPTQRKNGFITAIEKIILCEDYVRRIAKAVVQIQNENSNEAMVKYTTQRAGE
jgi:hypothetical protein